MGAGGSATGNRPEVLELLDQGPVFGDLEVWRRASYVLRMWYCAVLRGTVRCGKRFEIFYVDSPHYTLHIFHFAFRLSSLSITPPSLRIYQYISGDATVARACEGQQGTTKTLNVCGGGLSNHHVTIDNAIAGYHFTLIRWCETVLRKHNPQPRPYLRSQLRL